MGLFTRAIRPPEIPNGNDPVTAAPGTVGSPNVTPGDPHGLIIEGDSPPALPPPTIVPSAWSGWPAEWATPNWNGLSVPAMTDVAWMCLDLNANILSTMPPYLTRAAPSLDADWLTNPNPDVYTSWVEFAKQAFWDFMLGEAFVLATSRYSTGWPSRFHVVPPWAVSVELEDGLRRYRIGEIDVTGDLLHIRYQSSVSDARGHGALEVGWSKVVAAQMLQQYAAGLASGGGIPSSVLVHPQELMPEQAAKLQADWVQARLSKIGEPAVLSGGITWQATQLNPKEMSLIELQQAYEARIAYMLGVPAAMVGLPSNRDSMTYATVALENEAHWRSYLQPRAKMVMAALSGFLVPRGTGIELRMSVYIEPGPYERAQTDQILNSIRDATGNPAKTVAEIRLEERYDDVTSTQGIGVP